MHSNIWTYHPEWYKRANEVNQEVSLLCSSASVLGTSSWFDSGLNFLSWWIISCKTKWVILCFASSLLKWCVFLYECSKILAIEDILGGIYYSIRRGHEVCQKQKPSISYWAVMPANHNIDQHDKIFWKMTKTMNSSMQLQCLWTITITSQTEYFEKCNSSIYIMGENNSHLIGIMEHSIGDNLYIAL